MMLKDPKLAEQLGRQAYEKYWACPYTLDGHTTALINIYDEVLANDGINKDCPGGLRLHSNEVPRFQG